MVRLAIFILSLVLLLECVAQQKQISKSDAVVKSDTIGSNKNIQIIGVPLIFYTPETEFGFGIAGQLFWLNNSNIYNSRLSNLWANAIFTTKSQIIVDIKPQIFLQKGDYFIDAALKYKIFPNSFWGIGSETSEQNLESYNMTSTEINVEFLKRLPPTLNFGFGYVYENHKMTELDSLDENGKPGKLIQGDIEGYNGAVVSGVSVIFNLDSRDNIYSPDYGAYIKSSARFSSENLGATHSYNKFFMDMRTYLMLEEKNILAFQLYIENSFGDVPFQDMAWFGGGERGRGYFNGRFIDDHMYVIQGEIRRKITPRFRIAGFVLFGEVSDQTAQPLQALKKSFGGGIRYQITKKNPTLLRLDIGIGEDGQSGIYFGVNEAF